MRQSEILNLKWEHINLKLGVAHLPETKNGSKRDVPLSERARDALLRMGAKPAGKVFNYTNDGIKSTWRYLTIKLAIEDLHFHDLRHEAISRLFELGTLDMMEIAAISGHKSLSMLRRYTHLRASRLVKKLEGTKNKSRQAVLKNLVPYPAAIDEEDGRYVVTLLDFDNLCASGQTRDLAIRNAGDALLRRLVTGMKGDSPLPPPDQYLTAVDEATVVMIDPLQTQELAEV